MITKEQIEKIIEESYSNYPKFLSSTIEKIEMRFKAQATLHRVRKIEYIVTNPGPVADRLRRDLANYFTALGFFGGIRMNEDGDIVVTLSIDPPVESAPAAPVEVPPTPVDVDAPVDIPEENQ
jgi:hypothetical protein